MTTSTAPAPVWQASGQRGYAHAFTSLRPGVGRAICGDPIRPADERWNWPIRWRCATCRGLEGRPLERRVRSAHK